MLNIRVNSMPGVLEKLSAALRPEAIDPVVERVALQTFREVVEATPKHWFGQVRKSWQVDKPREGARVVLNDNKIMWFLEEGTRAHGPKGTSVSVGGFSAKGTTMRVQGNTVDQPAGFSAQRPVTKRHVRYLYIPLTRKASFGWQPGMKFGRDFILKKWVRGIEARHIAAKEADKAMANLFESISNHIQRATT